MSDDQEQLPIGADWEVVSGDEPDWPTTPEDPPYEPKHEWLAIPFVVLLFVGFAIVFVACAVGLWALTLGGGCALGWCPFN